MVPNINWLTLKEIRLEFENIDRGRLEPKNISSKPFHLKIKFHTETGGSSKRAKVPSYSKGKLERVHSRNF